MKERRERVYRNVAEVGEEEEGREEGACIGGGKRGIKAFSAGVVGR